MTNGKKENDTTMKKIINGRMYNTDTAKKLGSYQRSNERDFNYCYEALYVKKKGEYFVAGEGGPLTSYAHAVSGGGWTGGEDITPLTESEAREWVENHLSADEYIEIFGEPEE